MLRLRRLWPIVMNCDRDKVKLKPWDFDVDDVNLNDHVLRTIEHVRPEIVDNNIYFSLVMFTELWMTRIEPGEIQKILVSLVANSCESLPDGGRITIETANVSLSSADILNGSADLIPGDYVIVSFTDLGLGPSAVVNGSCIKSSLSDDQPPNSRFATRPAPIYESVRKSGGDTVLDNGQGPGTTVRLYFPRCGKQATICNTVPENGSFARRHSN